jgi:hypothetical protein
MKARAPEDSTFPSSVRQKQQTQTKKETAMKKEPVQK